MVFDFLKGEFIDVISWLDDTRDTMVWRFERRGQAIKYGAKLTVREGQAAVFGGAYGEHDGSPEPAGHQALPHAWMRLLQVMQKTFT